MRSSFGRRCCDVGAIEIDNSAAEGAFHPVNRVDDFLPWNCSIQAALRDDAASQWCDAIIDQIATAFKTALIGRIQGRELSGEDQVLEKYSLQLEAGRQSAMIGPAGRQRVGAPASLVAG